MFFATDDYSVDGEDRATLDAQARWLLANANVAVTIEGHADERGTREYNLALGDRRASAVKNYLAARGVPAGRMTTLSWGKERPVAQGSNEDALGAEPPRRHSRATVKQGRPAGCGQIATVGRQCTIAALQRQ